MQKNIPNKIDFIYIRNFILETFYEYVTIRRNIKIVILEKRIWGYLAHFFIRIILIRKSRDYTKKIKNLRFFTKKSKPFKYLEIRSNFKKYNFK